MMLLGGQLPVGIQGVARGKEHGGGEHQRRTWTSESGWHPPAPTLVWGYLGRIPRKFRASGKSVWEEKG